MGCWMQGPSERNQAQGVVCALGVHHLAALTDPRKPTGSFPGSPWGLEAQGCSWKGCWDWPARRETGRGEEALPHQRCRTYTPAPRCCLTGAARDPPPLVSLHLGVCAHGGGIGSPLLSGRMWGSRPPTHASPGEGQGEAQPYSSPTPTCTPAPGWSSCRCRAGLVKSEGLSGSQREAAHPRQRGLALRHQPSIHPDLHPDLQGGPGPDSRAGGPGLSHDDVDTARGGWGMQTTMGPQTGQAKQMDQTERGHVPELDPCRVWHRERQDEATAHLRRNTNGYRGFPSTGSVGRGWKQTGAAPYPSSSGRRLANRTGA